jgi:tetratricopeptide (TPR) repeat protein
LEEIKKAADFKTDCALAYPNVLHDLGDLYFKIGEPKTALSLFTQALQLEVGGENKIRLQLMIAQCYKALNMQEDYLALYDQILVTNDPFWSRLAKEKIEEINFSPEVDDTKKE